MENSRQQKSKHNTGIDLLRIVAALCVLSYHYINTCGVKTQFNMISRCVIDGFFWVGGRIAVNIFVIIGAYFLCEQEFKYKKIINLYVTTLFYSIIIGILFICQDGLWSLIRSLFPISGNFVWFVTVYIKLLLVHPLLNQALESKYCKQICLAGSVIFIIIPNIYPNTALKLDSEFGWFCFLYLLVGYLKNKQIEINKVFCVIYLFVSIICGIIWFECFELIPIHPYMELLGFDQNFNFGKLYALLNIIPATSLFYLFKNIGNAWREYSKKVIKFISAGTMDCYILLSMNSPNGILWWVDLFGLNEIDYLGIVGLMKAYLIIILAFALSIIMAAFRRKICNILNSRLSMAIQKIKK